MFILYLSFFSLFPFILFSINFLFSFEKVITLSLSLDFIFFFASLLQVDKLLCFLKLYFELDYIWIGWKNPTSASGLFFFFFFHAFVRLMVIGHALCNEQQQQNLTFLTLFSQSMHIMYCSRTHKFHFSATFSLKIDPTVLFTYLKIILLQYFSVSIFSFQLYPNGPSIDIYK